MMVIFVVLVIFILLEQKTNLNLMKKYVRIIFFYGIIMASQENNISQFNQYMKLDKMSYIIYADICAEHATNILNFKKKEMSLLTKEELKLPQDATNFYI